MDDSSPPLTPEILVPRIGEYLVEKGLISTDDLTDALEFQKAYKGPQAFPPLLGQVLVTSGKLSRTELDLAITEQIIQLRQALQNANHQLEQRVKERTEELEDALINLEEANQVKTNFIANISHELRTPLTHITGYINLLLNEDLGTVSSEQMEALQIVQRANERLGQLIEDLILFSSSQKQQLSLKITSFSIYDLSLSLLERIKSKAQAKNIRLEFSCQPNIVRVEADEEKISWVISHLLDNAIKFTPTDGEVSLQIERSGKKILVRISDSGIGMPENRLEEIFTPFHQLDGSSTRRYGGTGLGLSLARQIVESHGSVLCVTSKLGEGSQFEFLINTDDRSGNTLS
jgi:two-component system sensor histidine kinase/response regulator